MVAWNYGYKDMFLCEYYLLTGDKEVLPAVKGLTIRLARGQSMHGNLRIPRQRSRSSQQPVAKEVPNAEQTQARSAGPLPEVPFGIGRLGMVLCCQTSVPVGRWCPFADGCRR